MALAYRSSGFPAAAMVPARDPVNRVVVALTTPTGVYVTGGGRLALVTTKGETVPETDQQPRGWGRTPDGVTDPLLWRLAADVTEAHQPDETGHCDNLLCDGQTWPCEAARNARRALALAGAAPEEPAAPGYDGHWPAREQGPPALPQRHSRAAEAA
ncbi:hypothetical protein E1193_24035 [Micromonospora sp. KC606]|nr:hypothetical protein E1193_24035 [Micromonospora sp. KC606]